MPAAGLYAADIKPVAVMPVAGLGAADLNEKFVKRAVALRTTDKAVLWEKARQVDQACRRALYGGQGVLSTPAAGLRTAAPTVKVTKAASGLYSAATYKQSIMPVAGPYTAAAAVWRLRLSRAFIPRPGNHLGLSVSTRFIS